MFEPNLSTNIAGLKLRNPTVLAAGIMGISGELLKRVAESGAGAVITKSIGVTERQGHRTPAYLEPIPGIVLNAMGLPNPGYEAFKKEIPIAKQGGVPVIASIFGFTEEEFKEVAIGMQEAGADMLEVNVSCPNMGSRRLIAQDSEQTFKVVKAVKENVDIPVMVKLSPNVTDIGDIAQAAMEGGADAISAINTVRALYIDVEIGRPVLGNQIGGMSGFAIKPIAVRCVWEIARKAEELGKGISIVGVGGISSGTDAIEFIMAGACAVQIGTAADRYFGDIGIFETVVTEIKEFMIRKRYSDIKQIIGLSLPYIKY